MNALNNLTSSITEKLKKDGEWSLSRDEVLGLLNADIRDVYGLICGSSNPLVSFQTAEYSSHESGVLVTFLECLGYQDAPLYLWKAGIWIPYEIQLELQEELLEQVAAARKSHIPSFDEFLDIFDHYSNYIRSLQVYAEAFFSRQEFIKRAVNNILSKHPETNSSTASPMLSDLAEELFQREIIPLWNLLVPLFTELKNYLIRMKRIPETEKERHNEKWSSKNSDIKDKINAARKLFGYDDIELVNELELRKRYKKKMKKYHPDINPHGLELSKEINLAYALLLSQNQ